MNPRYSPGMINWTVRRTEISLLFVLIVLVASFAMFGSQMLPFEWLIPQIITILVFFLGYAYYARVWALIGMKSFRRKLFWGSFLVRMITIGIMYLAFYSLTGTPFEPDVGDSYFYHIHGGDMAKMFWDGNFDIPGYLYDNVYSDYGYNTFLGIAYMFLGPHTFVSRLFNVIFGSLTVLLIYRITATLYDEATGRSAGIMGMFFPYLLFYTGITAKETLMIYLLMVFVWKSIEIIEHKNMKASTLIILVLSLSSMFFFRNVLGILALLSFILYFTFVRSRSKQRKGSLIVIFFFVLILIRTFFDISSITYEVERTLETASGQMDAELATKASEGVSFQKVLMAPLLIVASFFAPFPSIVDTNQPWSAMQISAAFAKNIMVFFALLGMYFAIRKQFRRNVLLLSLTFGYVVIMIQSAFVTAHRFQLVTIPFILIFSAVGLNKGSAKLQKYWPYYLVFMFIAIMAWNWFKLSIRGSF